MKSRDQNASFNNRNTQNNARYRKKAVNNIQYVNRPKMECNRYKKVSISRLPNRGSFIVEDILKPTPLGVLRAILHNNRYA